MCKYCDWLRKGIDGVDEEPETAISKMDLRLNGIRIGVIETAMNIVETEMFDKTPVLSTTIYSADNESVWDIFYEVGEPIKYCPMCGGSLDDLVVKKKTGRYPWGEG